MIGIIVGAASYVKGVTPYVWGPYQILEERWVTPLIGTAGANNNQKGLDFL